MNKAVIFDFDGVIINSLGVQRYALKESYYQVTGKHIDENTIKDFFCNSGDSLSNIFTKMNLPIEMVEPYRKISIEQNGKIKLYKNIKELLSYLNNKGIYCGLCTGKDRERVVKILEDMEISDYFKAIVCSDDVKRPKPDPEGLFYLMKTMNVTKDLVVMVGDANNDLKCAKAAGIHSIGVTWGNSEREALLKENPDYIVDKVSELKNSINEILGVSEKKKYLINDFVVAEDKCNMQCEYCLTQTSQFKKEHDETSCKVKKLKDLTYDPGTKFQEDMDNIQDNLLSKLDVAVLKISGGEILMLPKIQNYILKQAKKFKAVQVLTNGVLLNEKIVKEYKEAGNICIQVSLDHHTMEGNGYRTKNKTILSNILKNIDMAYRIGVAVEINCVLTDKNIGILSSFLEYLNRYDKGVVVYPFPVRGNERDKYYVKEEEKREIENIIKNYDRYKNILAPKKYMEYLLDFLKTGRRKTVCTLPYMAVGVFEDGTVTPCPNYWFASLGSILEDPAQVSVKIGEDSIYRILTCERNPFKECRTCFTPWEVLNLYVDGVLSLEEVKKSPLYALNGIDEYIKEIKENIKK